MSRGHRAQRSEERLELPNIEGIAALDHGEPGIRGTIAAHKQRLRLQFAPPGAKLGGEQIREAYRGFRGQTARTIRYGQDSGVFRNDIDPDAAAARTIGTFTGVALQWLLDPGAFPLDDAIKQTEDMLIDYLLAGPKAVKPRENRVAVTA